MSASVPYPRPDVSESEKKANDYQWYKDHVDYAALKYCNGYDVRHARISRMQDQYNGIVDSSKFTHINSTYGKENAVPYIDYRLCHGKIDLMIGEELLIPLNGTVYTTNPDAHVQRLEEISTPVGMHYAKDKIITLREKVGVDVFNGLPFPDVPAGKTVFDTLSPKSKNESVMQIIANRQIDEMKLKIRFNDNFLDAVLNAECAGKMFINADNEVEMRSIPIEDFMFEESKRDPFLDKSPYLGERREMFYHEILKEFNLTKQQATDLWNMQNDLDSIDDPFRKINYPRINGTQAYSVYTIEFISARAERVKVYVDKNSGEEREAFLSSEYYESNEKKLRREESKGKYKIVTKYKFVLEEATRIGHNMYVKMGPVENMPASISRPAWTTRRYFAMLFGTVGGVRVSIKQLTEHLDQTYNMIMWQINRELAKAKGKVVTYDLASLPKGKTLKDVMFNMANESLLLYNSAEDGNEGNKTLEQHTGFNALDMGVSNTINVLIPLKVDIEQTADRITGILQNRMGNIAASATVSNTQQSVQASRTTTASLFYFFGNYIERGMRLMLEMSKISYGILKPELGEMILGAEKMQFLRATESIAFQDYGYAMGDITKDMKVRSMLEAFAPIILNSQPDMAGDILKSALSETTAEATGIITDAFQKINDLRQQEAKAQNDAAMEREMVAAQGQENVQRVKGENDLMKVAAQGNVQAVVEGQKGANAATLQRNQAVVPNQNNGKK